MDDDFVPEPVDKDEVIADELTVNLMEVTCSSLRHRRATAQKLLERYPGDARLNDILRRINDAIGLRGC